MQPKPLNSKEPPPRLNRPKPDGLHEGDGHLWAVSYADLLMVLMSFFVIFFSFTDSTGNGDAKSPDVVLQISAGLKAALKGEGGGGVAMPAVSRAPTALVDRPALEALGAEVSESEKSIFVKLPDDIFDKRQFALSDSTKAKLESILEALRSNSERIELVIIGHADSSRVAGSNPYLSNNFDLSSLRALKAVQFLTDRGFPESNISAQGSSYGLRNSRTLSLRVRVKEETP